MKKFARSVTAALALVMVAGVLSACADTETRRTSTDTSAQRASDSAMQSAKSANRAASVGSQK